MSKQQARSKKITKKTSKKPVERNQKKASGRQNGEQDVMDELLRQRFWDAFHDLVADQRKPSEGTIDLLPLLKRLSDLFPKACRLHHLWPPLVAMATIQAGTDLKKAPPCPEEWKRSVPHLALAAIQALPGMRNEYEALDHSSKATVTGFLLKHGFVSEADELTMALIGADVEIDAEVERRKKVLEIQAGSSSPIWFEGHHYTREAFEEDLCQCVQEQEERRREDFLGSAAETWPVGDGDYLVSLQAWKVFRGRAEQLISECSQALGVADLAAARQRVHDHILLEQRKVAKQADDLKRKREEADGKATQPTERPLEDYPAKWRAEDERALDIHLPVGPLAEQWVEMRIWQERYRSGYLATIGQHLRPKVEPETAPQPVDRCETWRWSDITLLFSADFSRVEVLHKKEGTGLFARQGVRGFSPRLWGTLKDLAEHKGDIRQMWGGPGAPMGDALKKALSRLNGALRSLTGIDGSAIEDGKANFLIARASDQDRENEILELVRQQVYDDSEGDRTIE